MLPPWVVTPTSGDFLVYDGLVKNATYKTDTNTWTSSDIVQNSTAQSLAGSVAVQALKVSAPLTVPAGMVLTNVTGGLILSSATLDGSGTIDSGTNDLIVYQTGTPWINPTISAPGLTVWGTGTLTVTNLTWSGDTFVHQGSLKTVLTQATVLENRNINGVGEFIKDGSASLTLSNSKSMITKFTWQSGSRLSLINSSLDTVNAITVPEDGSHLFITNSFLRFGNNTTTYLITGAGKNDTDTFIAKGSWLDSGGRGGVRIGNGGRGNMFVVDGGGVTGGAVITNMVVTDARGLSVGVGAGSSRNTLRIRNGGQIWDQIGVDNAGNNFGSGSGADSNLVEVIGGEGFVTTIQKGKGNTIGIGAATGNVVRVDAKGIPGSAVWLAPANDSLTVGSSGGFGNKLEILNGAKVTGGGLICGSDANSNRIEIAGNSTEWKGNGGGAQFSIGVGNSEGNTVVISDGAYVWNFTTWQGAIGGRGPGNYPTLPGKTSIGNSLVITNGGIFYTSNDTFVGYQTGAGAATMSNSVVITGRDSLWSMGGCTIYLGASGLGSKAVGNRIFVDNSSKLTSSRKIAVGLVSSVEGTAANDNGLIIRNGGTVRIPYYTYYSVPYGIEIGSTVTNNSVVVNAERNFCLVTDNGVLDIPVLYILSPGGNYIRIENGGVWQLSGRRSPSIISQQFGDISMDNGIVSFAEGTSDFTVRDNWNFSSWTNVQFTGNNGLRLNGITLGTTSDNSYLFESNISPTNWAFLQMVNGTTVYQTRQTDTGALTIGQFPGSNAEMLCSNTTARVAMPFVLNGKLRLVNSTLTITTNATVNGEVFIDLANTAVAGPFLAAQRNLTLGDSSTLRLSGAPVNGQVLMTYSGTRTGKFKVEGLPNDYSVKYDLGEAGTISILHTPTVIVIR